MARSAVLEDARLGQERYRVRGTPTLMLRDGTKLRHPIAFPRLRDERVVGVTPLPCHGEAHSGKGRLGPRVSVLPEDTLSVFPTQAGPITAEKVRHGKFFGIAGVMPFFALERLSDGELADILKYLLP